MNKPVYPGTSYVAPLWERALREGRVRHIVGHIWCIPVLPEDREAFPELAGREEVDIFINASGGVYEWLPPHRGGGHGMGSGPA